MGNDMLGISEATRRWQVSERTLRRRLSNNKIDGAERDDSGQWQIPTSWLSAEFEPIEQQGTTLVEAPPEEHAPKQALLEHDLSDENLSDNNVSDNNVVIDLRDTTIASGLAAALADVTDLTNRVIEAEVTAALASNESDHLNDRVRRLQGDLDAERARSERRQHDLSEAENALALERDRRSRSEADLVELKTESKASDEALRTQLADAQKAHAETSAELAALEGFVGPRKRAKFRRFRAE